MCTLHTLVIFSWSKNFIKSRVHRGGFIFKFVRHLSCNDCLWFLRVSFLSCFLLLRGINFLFQSSKIEKLGKLSHTSITKIRFLEQKKIACFYFWLSRGYNNYKEVKVFDSWQWLFTILRGFFSFVCLARSSRKRKKRKVYFDRIFWLHSCAILL